MWLMDHQMNVRLSEAFGQYFVRLPLKKSPTIVCGNALRLDWKKILPPEQCSYVLGNPPFVGKQVADCRAEGRHGPGLRQVKGGGLLDYVTGVVLQGRRIRSRNENRSRFVSTNSIIARRAGRHPLERAIYTISSEDPLCPSHLLVGKRGPRQRPTSTSSSSALPRSTLQKKRIYEYDDPKGEPHKYCAGTSILILRMPTTCCCSSVVSRSRCAWKSDMAAWQTISEKGEKGLGNLILDETSRAALLEECPQIAPYIRTFMGSDEFLNNERRWCLWLVDVPPRAGLFVVRALSLALRRSDEAA